MPEEKHHPPKTGTKDTAHLVAKGILSVVPGAAELFELFVKPPIEKRLERWREEVGDALRFLEREGAFRLDRLQADEKFISVLVQASRIAMRNHRKEKLLSLKNAVINSAAGIDIEEDLQFIFIRYIDELSPSHLSVLRFFIESYGQISHANSYQALYQEYEKHSSDTPTKDVFKLLVGDLSARNLIRISQDIVDFEDIYQGSFLLLSQTDDSLPTVIVTDVGKSFIRFISESKVDTV